MASVPSPAGGKSYANLAGKVMPASAQAPVPGSSAWTTVGAGGKTKLPAAPSPAPAARAPSSTVLPAVQTAMSSAVKKAPSRSATLTGSGAVNAQEEFRKWAINELRPDLNPGLTGKSTLVITTNLNKANPFFLQPNNSSQTSSSSRPRPSSLLKLFTAAAAPSTLATSPRNSFAARGLQTRASWTLLPHPRAVVPLMRLRVVGVRSPRRDHPSPRHPRRTLPTATSGSCLPRRRVARSKC